MEIFKPLANLIRNLLDLFLMNLEIVGCKIIIEVSISHIFHDDFIKVFIFEYFKAFNNINMLGML